jgi:hypothetical protein
LVYIEGKEGKIIRLEGKEIEELKWVKQPLK